MRSGKGIWTATNFEIVGHFFFLILWWKCVYIHVVGPISLIVSAVGNSFSASVEPSNRNNLVIYFQISSSKNVLWPLIITVSVRCLYYNHLTNTVLMRGHNMRVCFHWEIKIMISELSSDLKYLNCLTSSNYCLQSVQGVLYDKNRKVQGSAVALHALTLPGFPIRCLKTVLVSLCSDTCLCKKKVIK